MYNYNDWAAYIGALELNANPISRTEWMEIIKEDFGETEADESLVKWLVDQLEKEGYVK